MKAKVTIGIVMILIGYAIPAFAQMTAYANIYAQVVAPVGIEKTADMTFSEISSSKKSGSVVLSADNTLTASGIELTQSSKGTIASFSVTGSNQTTFDVSLPRETFTISDGASTDLMVSNFTSTPSTTNSLQNSARVIKIGATLQIPENYAAGNYSAQNSFPVTLNYN